MKTIKGILLAAGFTTAISLCLWRPCSPVVGSAATAWAKSKRESIGKRFHQEQGQVRRARHLLRRALKKSVSPELRVRLEELEKLLDERERYIAALARRHNEFVIAHGPELDELKRLKSRMNEIRLSLAQARKQVLAESENDVEALLSTSDEARELATALKEDLQAYRRQKRRR